MPKTHSLLVAALIVGLAGCERPVQAQKSDAPIVTTSQAPELEAASEEARKTLPVFWAKFKSGAPGYGDFRLKVSLPTDDSRGEEHIWMTVEEVTPDQQVRGRLSNEPAYLKKLHQGSLVEVDPSRIDDWMYAKDGKAYGHYTTRAMMTSIPPQQRAETAAFLAPTPLETATN